MKIIKSGNELIGKKIAFAHIAQFADNITIATEDGGVLIVTQYVGEDDDTCTQILNEAFALNYIENNDYVRNSLADLGLFDKEKYMEKKRKEMEEREKQRQERKEKEERELYEKLKAKYER